jgi:hypothetical protein
MRREGNFTEERAAGELELLELRVWNPMFLTTRNREPFSESTPLMGAHSLSVSLLQIFRSSYISFPQGFYYSVETQHSTVSAAHFTAFLTTNSPLRSYISQRGPKATDQRSTSTPTS